MALFSLRSKGPVEKSGALSALLEGASIEVMPRTAAKIESFRDLLPAGTRVYVAHIEGTPIDEMVASVSEIAASVNIAPNEIRRMADDPQREFELRSIVQAYLNMSKSFLQAGSRAK